MLLGPTERARRGRAVGDAVPHAHGTQWRFGGAAARGLSDAGPAAEGEGWAPPGWLYKSKESISSSLSSLQTSADHDAQNLL